MGNDYWLGPALQQNYPNSDCQETEEKQEMPPGIPLLSSFHPPDHNCLSFLLDSLQLNVMLLQCVPENLHAERTQLKRAAGWDHRKGLYRQQHTNFLPGKF